MWHQDIRLAMECRILDFAIRFEQMQMEGTKIHVYTEVENTGRIYDGKEVVQIYVSCPNGELKKEAQRLTAFA